jgi:hypothetical protein
MAIGLAGIVVAWAGASGTLTWRNQLIWTAVAAGAVLLAGSGGALWLLSGFGVVKAEQQFIKQLLRTRYAVERPQTSQMRQPGNLVWAPGMTRYHSSACELVVGKSVQSLSEDDLRRLELLPCGMCQS